ncbi:glycosyl transferase family protein [Candidatus Nitrosoglobus terrae]|uniref:Glycosyl transferase family protein n=1 Tax=Candidatus Nitrosoglobus terrae TaxID=1630141 RepID=A0A1Q2SK99_9GAMM|nr:class I SAM-dependent methyltransferase [Candidatus Nitrosoglobus terrae]BAW79540.1 glycosyl transferase family protein [Candidatus Nitrosoglobus terrae]
MSKDTSSEKLGVIPAAEAYIYQRNFDPQGEDSLAKIARLIRPHSRVLDLGTGPGILGQYLSTILGCTVDGVELSLEQVQIAAPFYRNLLQADLEQVDLAALFPESYDYVVAADIFEHLRNPEAIVSQLPALLGTEGRAMLSVPNIAHAGVIAELLAGEFRYRPEGLLDTTHVRFFTRQSLLTLLTASGLAVLSIDTVRYDLRESEFKHYYLDTLPPAIYRLLAAYPDSLTYQFIVEVTPEQQAANLNAIHQGVNKFYFSTQMYWRFEGEEYQEENSIQALGVIGDKRQVIQFSFPLTKQLLSGIRIDLADRPGFLRLYEIALYDSDKNCLWRWEENITTLLTKETHQVEFASGLVTSFGTNMLLTGEDPYIELPLSESDLKPLKGGGTLALILSWPISADFMALTQCLGQRDRALIQQQQLIALQNQQAHEKDKLLALKDRQQQENEQLLAHITEQLNEKERLIVHHHFQLREISRTVERQNNQMSYYETLIKSLEFQLRYRDSWRSWIRRPLRPLKRWWLKIIEIVGR